MRKKISGRISDEVLYPFFVNAGVALSMGKSPSAAMLERSNTVKDKKLRRVLDGIRDDLLLNGTPFSEAFRIYEKQFPSEIVPMLSFGEATGTMPVAVRNCEVILQTRMKAKRSVKSEMTYPMFVLVILFAVVLMALIFIYPAFAALFPQGEMQGFSTVLLVTLTVFLSLVVLFFVSLILYRFCPGFAVALDRIKIKSPVLGRAERANVTVICASCLDVMMKNGLSGIMIYEMLIRIVPNKWVKENLKDSLKDLYDGVPINICLHTTKGFTDFFYSVPLLSEGFCDGGRSPLEICSEMAEYEMQSSLKRIMSAVQPVMLLLIGGFVLAFFISIMLPYVEYLQGMML